MTNLSEARTNVLTIVSNTETSVARLLPLLSLLETPEQPDRLGQMLEVLHLILDIQYQQADVLKSYAERLDRLARR
ncbi:hypothetical protein J2Y63_006943 [Shinella sp. BE166]|uniref:hypothetical protein n=1 Tax=Shinella sp. BE166 TaxID=3373918 RepID=UPI003EBDC876